MTDSFTPFCKNVLRSCCVAVAVILAVWAPGSWAQAGAPEITQLYVERAEDGVFLTAQTTFELSPVVQEALLKQVAVHFIAQAQLLRDRWYWYDKKLATATRHMRLSYHPLTRRWRLNVSTGNAGSNPGGALNQNFDTLADALAALSRLSRWKIAEATDVDPEARHNVDFSFRLDLSELPRPFQIGVIGQADWVISLSKNVSLNPEAGK